MSLQRLAALPLLLLAGFGAWHFPVSLPVLGSALLVTATVCWRLPTGWLFLLPALLPLADTAPWTGRLFLQEIDLFLLVMLAGALWHGQFAPARHHPLPRLDCWLIAVFVAGYLASLHLGLTPYPPRDNPNTYASYYSHYNGLRVARGVVWAVAFLPPLAFVFRRTPHQARHALLGGVLVGLFGTGLCALWERGVWHDLLTADNIYDRLDGLLDFSTPYRVTGLFSGMHTGGESIDGYLVLAWPCALVAALLKDAPRSLRWLALLTLPLACTRPSPPSRARATLRSPSVLPSSASRCCSAWPGEVAQQARGFCWRVSAVSSGCRRWVSSAAGRSRWSV